MYGDFTAWICGCGTIIPGKNDPLPDGWRIIWPKKETSSLSGIYCTICWDKIVAPIDVRIEMDGYAFRRALISDVISRSDRQAAAEIVRQTSERLAVGKRYDDVMGKDYSGIEALVGAGLNHRCWPSGAPPDVAGILMVCHPSAIGDHCKLYDHLQDLARRYDREIHMFWDTTRWYLVFADYDAYNTAKCEFWVCFYPDGTLKLLGVS